LIDNPHFGFHPSGEGSYRRYKLVDFSFLRNSCELIYRIT
jgi:hypothetical protein